MNLAIIRTRWAAVGATVAITLGAGGIGVTSATTSSGERPIYAPIEPCRLADLRPAPHTVGPRAAPLGPDETYVLPGWGTVGECALPTGTTGLALNVTAVAPTLLTFLTLFPADSTLPLASHLNPAPGQPPTPNAVNVDLDGNGEFGIYNLRGLVGVIIDVVGYYDDHTHDDRYYQQSDVDALLATKVAASQVLSAVVAADGTLDRGIGAVSATGALFGNPGWYEVEFDRNVSQCAFSATPGEIGNSGVPGDAIIAVAGRFENKRAVFVHTQDAAGADITHPFHLVVICPTA